ncbi:MAG: TonB-dependent receptor [Nitrospirales bacterium]|nr:TonB-dependent receptor [Nitrospira sp.]MDR4501397.1 TonB-dependent receptor [Nitrospirales bacterium]
MASQAFSSTYSGLFLSGFLFVSVPLWFVVPVSHAEEVSSKEEVQELPVTYVSGNRIEEDVEDVPIPISVLKEQDLVDRKVYRLEDLTLQLPNLFNAPESQRSVEFTFRGLGPSFFIGQSPVVLMVDGMPISQNQSLSLNLANVEQVEFLRGAQNTLFGQSAIGGVINVTTSKPTNEVKAHVEGYAGARNSYRGEAALSAPLVEDKLFLGLAYTHWRTDGFIQNTYPGTRKELNFERQDQFNLNLNWYPTARYSGRVFLIRDVIDSGQERAAAVGAIDHRVETVSHDIEGRSDFENNRIGVMQKYAMDKVEFSSMTSASTLNRRRLWDNDFGSGNSTDGRPLNLKYDTLTVTQELLAQSSKEQTVKWSVGGFFEYDNRDIDQAFPRSGATPPPGTPINLDTHLQSRTQTFLGALFGQARIPVTDQGGLTLGARGQMTHRDFKNLVFLGTFFPANPTTHAPSISRINTNNTWWAFMPRAMIDYHLTDQVLLWASYARGHLPGGYNFLDLSAGFFQTADRKFKSQKSNDFEVGLKSHWWDRRWIFNVNFFYIDSMDYQTLEFRPNGGIFSGNAGKVVSKGVEIESILKVTSWLTLDTAIGITNAEFKKYHVSFADNTGNYVQRTPSHTIHVGLQYRQSPFMARVDWNQVGTVFFDNENTFKQSPYNVVNIRVGYEREHWAAYVTVDNLMDTEYAIRAAFIDDPQGDVSWGNPRTIGGVLRLFFG